MKWKLPFTSRYARIEDKIREIEEQIGGEKDNPTRSYMTGWYASSLGFIIPKSNIITRLDNITDRLGRMEDYFQIETKTTPEKKYYRKVVKKSK